MIGKCNTGGGENLSEVIATQKQLLTDMENLLDTKGAYLQQTKTVTPVPEGSEVNPDEGYLLSQVLLNPFKLEGLYVWKKLTAEGGDFVDFTVDNDPTAYPDGGVQDGYWYEKVKDGISLSILNCTKFAVDKFTFSSFTRIDGSENTQALTHSLDKTPKIVLLTSSLRGQTEPNYYYIAEFSGEVNENGGLYYVIYSISSNIAGSLHTSGSCRATANNITLWAPSYGSLEGFYPGVEYTLITMA